MARTVLPLYDTSDITKNQIEPKQNTKSILTTIIIMSSLNELSPPKDESLESTPSTQPPSNANEGCVGPSSASAGQASACEGCPNQGACSSGAFNSPEALSKEQEETRALQQALQPVEHVVLVLSGKGGVGKSTLASQIAHTLAHQGYAVGLLDVDLCGPSAPRMAGVNVGGNQSNNSSNNTTTYVVHQSGSGLWNPIFHPTQPNLLIMSIAFLLPDPNAAVVWRGPRKNALIQQFLTQVDWSAGDTNGLDYLIIDTPPGTSDEHISTVQYLQRAKASHVHAVVVTTPEEVSLQDVRKELNFCQKTRLPVLGVVENMSVLQTTFSQLSFSKDGVDITHQILQALKDTCPEILDCQITTPFLPTIHRNGAAGSGAQQMAEQYQVPFWGSLPLDPLLGQCCEQGQCMVDTFPQAPATKCLLKICGRLVEALPLVDDVDDTNDKQNMVVN